MKKMKVAITVDPGVWSRIGRMAKASKRSRSAIAEQFMVEGLAGSEHVVRMFNNDVIRTAFLEAFTQPGVLRNLASAMEAEVGPEQLELFERAMRGVAEAAGGPKGERVRKRKGATG